MSASNVTAMFRNVVVCRWSVSGKENQYYPVPRVQRFKDQDGRPKPPIVSFKAQYYDGEDYYTVIFKAYRDVAQKVISLNLRCDEQYRSHLDITAQLRHGKYEQGGKAGAFEYYEIALIDYAPGFYPPDEEDGETAPEPSSMSRQRGPRDKEALPGTSKQRSVPGILLGTAEDPFLHYR